MSLGCCNRGPFRKGLSRLALLQETIRRFCKHLEPRLDGFLELRGSYKSSCPPNHRCFVVYLDQR